ncbi:serine hydrolase domain-containing protein [Psychrobium sp. nBUS_13]|uniref:serine hydrolase domain-containing protein n=1 Tax=Psychrobium sp. nBUS_13 TaxID=3395319 RepID=UPI003EB843D8
MPSVLDIVRGIKPTNSDALAVLVPPASQLRYSGAGYTLAELAMQDIFKLPFEQITQQWLFTPSGMETADFTQPVNPQKHQSIAQGHKDDGTTVKGGWRNHPEQAAAGLWTNANDLALFLSEIGKGYRGNSKVFSKGVIDELFNQEIENHFYGFRTLATGDNLAIAHYGGTQGYRSAMVLDVTTGNGAVVLTNSNNGSLLTGDILRSVAKHYQWPYLNATFFNQIIVDKTALQSFIGQYEFKKKLENRCHLQRAHQ